MSLLQRLFIRVNGLQYRQEYLCLDKETFHQPLYVYLVDYRKVIADVSESHSLVGYNPLIIAFPSGIISQPFRERTRLIFSRRSLHENETFRQKDAIAGLDLRKISQQNMNAGIVCFYEGISGRHHFISKFHQTVNGLGNRWYGKKPGNVFLKGNLYEQVQIGYSIPRKICLITVGQNDLYNCFPTDLHGKIDGEHYLISLRHGGRACKQVEASGKIVLSDMDLNSYKKVYSLGKNHTQLEKEKTAFDFSVINSQQFELPLPNGATSYRELEVLSSFITGIHKLILFRTVHEQKIALHSSTLVHIHNCYATWRSKQGLGGNYLMR